MGYFSQKEIAMPAPSRPPAYCRQRETDRADRAYVRIDGRKIKLGVYGSPQSRRKYAELIDDWEQSSTSTAPETADDPTVSEVILAYLQHAERYYRQADGAAGREYEMTVDVCRYVRGQAGCLLAVKFGPKKLKSVRQELIDACLSRKYINKQIDRVRRMFRWAAEEELVPAHVPQALSMVAGLRRGRTDARETQPTPPWETAVR